MSFAWPPMLLALALVPLGVLAARAIERRRRERAALLVGMPSAAGRAAGSGVRTRLPAALAVAGFAVLAVALARPQATVSLPHLEGTVMLAFDVSGSMAADEAGTSRMDAAKAAAKAIVDRATPGVVIGVVAFSDSGASVQPPSSDPVALHAAIDRLAPARGTSLGQGILAALQAIDQATAPTPPDYYSNRSPAPTPTPAPAAPGSDAATVIVLLSDGENNERPDPLAAAQEAASRGIRIIALGVGSAAGSTIDLDGFRVHTQLDEAALRRVAEATDGRYFPVADAGGVNAVYDDLARRLVVRSEPLEVTALFAGTAILLLVTGGVLSLAWAGRIP